MLKDKLKQSADHLYGTSEDLPRVIEIDMEKLRPNPDQPRSDFDETSLAELASSIESHGLIQPITVVRDAENEDLYLIVAGERRFRAFQRLGRATIPAITTSGNPDEIALIENIQRQDLSPLDEADALAKMMERHGYTQEELGKVVGKKQNTVSELLGLNALPQEIKDEYRTSDTKVSKSALVELSRVKDKAEQLKIWEEVKSGGLTVRAARAKKGSKKSKKSSSPSPTRTLIDSGRRFIARLERTQDPLDNDSYNALLELYKQIGERIEKLAQPPKES